MRPPRDRSLLTTGEAARTLGVSQDTVARMCAARELPCVRTPGGHARVPRAAVDALVRGEPLPDAA